MRLSLETQVRTSDCLRVAIITTFFRFHSIVVFMIPSRAIFVSIPLPNSPPFPLPPHRMRLVFSAAGTLSLRIQGGGRSCLSCLSVVLPSSLD